MSFCSFYLLTFDVVVACSSKISGFISNYDEDTAAENFGTMLFVAMPEQMDNFHFQFWRAH